MKNKKHLWTIVIAVALGSAILVACGAPATPTPVPPTPTPAATPTPSASEHMALGIEYYEQGKLDEAIAEFKEAIELEPDDADAHRNLGTAYVKQGKWEEAAAAYEEAIRLNPDYGEAYGDLVGPYANLGKLSEAIATGEKAIELAPNYATAHNNLGLAYDEQGRLDEAITEFQEAIKINPDYAEAHNNLGAGYYEQGRLDEAIAEWEETIRINPNHAKAHFNLGLAYADQGQVDEAIAQFETHLRLRPDAPNRAAVEEWIAEHKGPAVELPAEYRNPLGGYSVRYPEGWFYVEKKANVILADTKEALEAPLEAALKESPMVIFSAGSLAELAETLGLKETADPAEFLKALGQLFEETGETQTVEVGGYPAAIADLSATMNGTPYKGSHMIVLVEEMVIHAIAMSPPDKWEALRPTLNAMSTSLSFGP